MRKVTLDSLIAIDLGDGDVIYPRSWGEFYRTFDFYVEQGYKPAIHVNMPAHIPPEVWEGDWNNILEEVNGVDYVEKGWLVLHNELKHGGHLVKDYDAKAMRENISVLKKYLSKYVEEA